MCQICSDWEDNQLSSDKAFQLIGQSLKLVKDRKGIDHLMDLCDKIVDSIDKKDELHN